MVKGIAIHTEGGGKKYPETLAAFRTGMSQFLKPVVDKARSLGVRWRVIPCGGRKEAYDSFCDALVNESETHHILLVDAEDPVTENAWDHLGARQGDKWKKPPNATDNQCHLMAVTMETWFIADPDAVKEFYKKTKGFDPSALPDVPALPKAPKVLTTYEAMSKDAVNDVFRKATKETKSGKYEKIKHGAKLLEKIDPAKVRQRCPSCDSLFRAIEKLFEEEK